MPCEAGEARQRRGIRYRRGWLCMSFGERIKRAREALGMTQKELASRCGVTGSTIGSYEKGRKTPRTRVIERLSKELHVPAMELLRELDGENRSNSTEQKE